MDSNLLFTSALGLQAPWQVTDIRFEQEQGEIHFDLAYDVGSAKFKHRQTLN